MKKTVFILFLFVWGIAMQAQSYKGTVKRTVNFRASATTSSEKLGSLPKGTQLFLFSNIPEGDYYHVIVLETGVEGYIYNTYVQVGKVIPENKEGLFKQGNRIKLESFIQPQ